jgi:hypothetical protein
MCRRIARRGRWTRGSTILTGDVKRSDAGFIAGGNEGAMTVSVGIVAGP